ncbi:kynurenine 3-monooxygenase, mitochondrial precursor [Ptychographa xylographoides]|nr:kynurenine 3-monooxygenase, mitochondrial precursor [Ptychographa xylographoides]
MTEKADKRKVVVIGAGPVGALAALYAAVRGDDVEVYELRGGMSNLFKFYFARALISHFYESVYAASVADILAAKQVCLIADIIISDPRSFAQLVSKAQRDLAESVRILDLRDPSTTPLNFTKSINLALSERGINSMRQAGVKGLIEDILKETIPMNARMIHGRSKLGDLYEDSQQYDVHGRSIHAVDRAGLNKRLLDSLEAMPNVTFFFDHKLTGADFKKNTAWFEHRLAAPKTDHAQNASQPSASAGDHQRNPEKEVHFDLLIGADGAHSAARYHLMKFARVNYQQEYIDTLWCEFHISARAVGSEFAISPNHLHIWPGSSFMFIAIPSLDHSFTCTLFAPSSTFASLNKDPESSLPSFFDQKFPGVSPELITKEDLIKQFSENPHLPLISIKCTPYHYGSSAVIVGDAAHAMVPFYGQGMNAGLEDVRVLFDFLDDYGVYKSTSTSPSLSSVPSFTTSPSSSPPALPSPSLSSPPSQLGLSNKDPSALAAALSAYTKHRTPDAQTINDLALNNYLEMRSSVTSPLYQVRKFVEETLYHYFPSLGWGTQYSRVSFSNERYSAVKARSEWQGKVLHWVVGGVGLGLSAGILWGLKTSMGLKAKFGISLVRA